ncbi:hypothetical protein FOA43_004570 [Brettanomyces nanus]|uniref:Uncharacterized protein n=1 Tax=Eeniella nana TaxID=13502 RepID=A0A875SEV8_EENNA|nr:uncharacterized protein FOA43_004570 [Brettanomyces nanus]QPG77164.1 hypothetical protein FOA43_004570 [Brettanomyces nanus]
MNPSALQVRIQKSLARFKERIENGAYYEAQQTIRAVTNRYVHIKNYEAATQLLYQSAMVLTEYKKYDEASDLYLYLLEVFTLEKKQVKEFENSDLIKILDFLNALPDSDANISNLATETFKFTTSKMGTGVGFPKLNRLIGEKLYYSGDGKEVNLSQQFLLLSDETECLTLLANLYFDSYKKEGDVYDFGSYLVRLVIPYLLLRNVEFAQKSISIMLKKLKLEPDQPFKFTKVKEIEVVELQEETSNKGCSQLVNFLQLLVATCKRSVSDNGKNLRILYHRYEKVIDQYSGMAQMVDAVGQEYFKVNLIKKQSNLLQDMMGSFLGGGNSRQIQS